MNDMELAQTFWSAIRTYKPELDIQPGISAVEQEQLRAMGVPESWIQWLGAGTVRDEVYLVGGSMAPLSPEQIGSEKQMMDELKAEQPALKWQIGWIPLGTNYSGQYLCLDPEGSLAGCPGGIVYYDEYETRYEFASIGHMLRFMCFAAEHHWLDADDASDQLAELYGEVSGVSAVSRFC